MKLYVREPNARRYREATPDDVSVAASVIAAGRLIGKTMSAPADSVEYLQSALAGRTHEIFAVIFLDNRHRVIAFEELFRGTIDNTTVHPREIVRRCLILNAAAIILAHNHPSGEPEPSDADRLITRRIRDACELLDVRLLDHFICCPTRCVSLASRGLL